MRAAADTFSAECDAMEHSCDVDDTSLLQEPAKPWHTQRRALHSMPSGPVGLPQLAQYRHAATSQGYNLTELLTAKISDTNTSECPSLQTMLFLKNSAANAKDMDLSLEVVMLVVLIASGVLSSPQFSSLWLQQVVFLHLSLFSIPRTTAYGHSLRGE